MPQRRLLERLTVASLLIYPSRPSTPADREAVGVVFAGIKQGSARHLARAAQRLAELPAEHPVRQAVPAGALLVPAPGHAPLARGALWPAREAAAALLTAGVGAELAPLLERTERVRRSTGARSGAEREPPLRHYQTIALTNTLQPLEERQPLVLVDDVVTTGSTLIACASRLAELAPHAPITALALARAERHHTLQAPADMLDPAAQTITLSADEARPRRS